jgi:hypothetical protein
MAHLSATKRCRSQSSALVSAIRMVTFQIPACAFVMLILAPGYSPASAHAEFSMAQVLHYPFATQLAAAERGDVVAWVCNLDGVRNVWVARGPAFTPAKVTQFTEDDGQEITQLTFSPDGTRLVFVLLVASR